MDEDFKEEPEATTPETQEETAPEEIAEEMEDLSLTQENNSGIIKVRHEVVASIVRIAVLKVPGVVSVGTGGFKEEFVGLFNKRDSAPGISVAENDGGQYQITIKVVLKFGVELAKVGEDIQSAVRDEVTKMTNKKVARVDVLIDGVRMDEAPE